MKVLVGVDGSSNSMATIAFVGRFLSIERDELILSYISPPMPFADDEQLDPAVAARAQAAISGAVFEEAVARLSADWRSRVERAELSGSPSAGLLAAAEARGVDLIAVGFRGAGLFERFMLGSVSRAVVQSASVPVLVVKSAPAAGETATESELVEERPLRAAGGPPRVLIAYDGLEIGAKIAAAVNRVGWPNDTRGWVMTVVRPMFIADLPNWLKPIARDADVGAMAEAWQKEHEQQVAQAGAEMRQFQQTLPPCFQTSEPLVTEGRAGDRLLAAIVEHKIDLAIVGSRGRGSVASLLLGSTSDRIVTDAPCSVLIVR